MGEGVLAEECPVVAVVRLHAPKERQQLPGEVRNARSAAPQQKESAREPQHHRVPGILIQLLPDKGQGLGSIPVHKKRYGLDVPLFSLRDSGRKGRGTRDACLRLCNLGPQHQHYGDRGVGERKAFICLRCLLELLLGTEIL